MLGGCVLFSCNPHTQVETRLNKCMNATEAELSDHADAMLFSISLLFRRLRATQHRHVGPLALIRFQGFIPQQLQLSSQSAAPKDV